jgi:hypothetical protein
MLDMLRVPSKLSEICGLWMLFGEASMMYTTNAESYHIIDLTGQSISFYRK